MIKIILLFLLISSASFAGDVEKKEVDPATIAKLYLGRSLKESRSQIHGDLKIKIKGCTIISVKEVDDSFFGIDIDFARQTKETRELFEFLKNKGFIVTLGKIFPAHFYLTKNILPGHIPIKKEYTRVNKGLEVSSDTVIPFIIELAENKNLFHATEVGIFLRNKLNNNDAVFSEELLNHSAKAKELLDEVKRVNQIISDRFLRLNETLNTCINTKELLDTISASPEDILPEITIKQLRENQDEPLGALRKIIGGNEDAHDQRVIAINLLHPTPIDIMLLYAFYHFEEAKKLILTSQQIDVLNSFSENDELSITNLLRPYAYEVLEKLSFDKLKPPKKKKAKKKKKSIKPNSTLEVAAESEEEDVPTVIHLSEHLKDQKEESTSEIPASPIAFESVLKEEPKLPPIVTVVKPLPSFKLEKEHRMLDMLARLLSRELCLSGDATGSVSVALIKEKGRDKLAIALKHTRRNTASVVDALNKVILYSEYLAHKVSNFNDFIRQRKNLITQTDRDLLSSDPLIVKKASHLRSEARQEIDKIKLHLFLSVQPKTEMETRLRTFLKNRINGSSITLVNNALNYHSELALAEFLLDGNHELGILPYKGSPKKYQYIGNSIKMCSKCTGILSGGRNVLGFNELSIAFHFRGSYQIGYPNYMVPARSFRLNGCDRFQLGSRLDCLGSASKSITLGNLIILQNPEVSDTEEEK